jgi:lytic murein transglycosylase
LSVLLSLPLLAAAPLQAQQAPAPDLGPRTVLTAPVPPRVEPTAPPPIVDPMQQRFQAWLAAYRPKALAAGVGAATLDAQLSGLTYNPRVVGFDRAQPDDSRAVNRFDDYLGRRLNDARIAQGRRVRGDLAATLASIEARSGVPGHILVGIWGMETSYGAAVGDFDLIRAIASLAFDGRRAELFTRELTSALLMLDRGHTVRQELKGSWAGATGQPQFLPSSYLAYSADGDGDGHADIWGSRADTLASIANFLAKNGWRAGGSWGTRAYIPPTLDRGRIRNLVAPTSCRGVLSRHSRWIPVREWKALGVVPLGAAYPADDVLAALVEPDGPGNGGYITYGNYRAILEYNCSNYYALSVALLADAVR